MDEDEIKNDGMAIVIILVAFALLGLIGYLVGFEKDEGVISGEDIDVTSTMPIITPTPNIEP